MFICDTQGKKGMTVGAGMRDALLLCSYQYFGERRICCSRITLVHRGLQSKISLHDKQLYYRKKFSC